MKTVDELFVEAADAAGFARGYASEVASLLHLLDAAAVGRVADILMRARSARSTVFLAGNGGSAATASHWAVDLVHGTSSSGSLGLRAVSLTDNVPTLTALANDRSYEDVFAAQLEQMMQPGDVLVVISASGNSPNVVRAVEYAKTHGATTAGLLGFDGGRLKDLCDVSVVVTTPHGQYGPVEDMHIVITHILTMWMKCGATSTA